LHHYVIIFVVAKNALRIIYRFLTKLTPCRTKFLARFSRAGVRSSAWSPRRQLREGSSRSQNQHLQR